MTRKTLDITGIQNELEGGSAFFPAPRPSSPPAAPRTAKKKPSNTPTARPSTRRPVDTPPPDVRRSHDAQKERMTDVTPDTMPSTTQSRTNDPTTAGQNDTTVSRHHATTPPPIEPIRRAVKQIGKEAATHRFTTEEKRAIADIVYTLGQQGYRTSENEIARIAINSLLLDYQEHGEQSILYCVIKALNA